MAITIDTGTLVAKLEVKSGVSSRGTNWYRQQIVVEVGSSGILKHIAPSAIGDLVHELEGYKVGEQVRIHYSVKSREYKGNWYHDVDLYKIERVAGAVPEPEAPADPAEDLPY